MGPLELRLLVVSGKGGVGKSTVAAALALRSARLGRRTLVCEVNGPDRIPELIERRGGGPEVTQVDENLWVVNVRPAEAMREYGLMVLRFKAVYRLVFENRLVRYFLRFIPSLQELVMLGKVLFHYQEQDAPGRPRFDQIIVDAPATGHAISFLSVPQVLLDTVPAGPMQVEARKMRDILVDPAQTATLLVALPEEMPVNEAIELGQALTTQVGMRTSGVVLNAAVAPRFDPGEVAALPPPLRTPAQEHLLRARATAESAARLATELRTPVVTLPRLYVERLSRDDVSRLGEQLAVQLGGASLP